MRVSRPMEVVVLNCWVTETNETPWRIEDLHQLGKIGERAGQAVDFVDDHDIDLAGLDILEQPPAGRGVPGCRRNRPPSS